MDGHTCLEVLKTHENANTTRTHRCCCCCCRSFWGNESRGRQQGNAEECLDKDIRGKPATGGWSHGWSHGWSQTRTFSWPTFFNLYILMQRECRCFYCGINYLIYTALILTIITRYYYKHIDSYEHRNTVGLLGS